MEGLFKTSAVGGFKKEDVLAYIDKQDADFQEKERALSNRITELTKELDQVKKEKNELQSKVGELEAEVEAEKERVRMLKSENDEISARAESAETACERAKAELDSEKGITSALRQKEEESDLKINEKDRIIAGLREEIQDLRETISKKMDSEDRIGRVMMEAQNTADKMIDAAQIKADRILSEAKEKMQQLLMQAADFKNEIRDLRGRTSATFQRVDELLKNIEDSAAAVSDEYSDVFDFHDLQDPAENESSKETAAGFSSFDFSQNREKGEENEE